MPSSTIPVNLIYIANEYQADPTLLADKEITITKADDPNLAPVAGDNAFRIVQGAVDSQGNFFRITSNPILRSGFKSYSYEVFSASQVKAIEVDFSPIVPIVGDFYELKIIGRDLSQGIPQFQPTFPIVQVQATTANPADLALAFANAINAQAATSTDTFANAVGTTLTVRGTTFESLPEVLKGLNLATAIVTVVQNADPGQGEPVIVRQWEEISKGHRGFLNRVYNTINSSNIQYYTDNSVEYDIFGFSHRNSIDGEMNGQVRTNILDRIALNTTAANKAALITLLETTLDVDAWA